MRRLHFVIPLAVALGASAAPFAAAQAQVGIDISVNVAPPELPVYEQPPLPAPGYIFVPGYWAYGDEGYYWVPATWVEPPEPGLLWTPGYWAFDGGRYIFNAGYWGTTVGYYGGIDYGFGYGGLGYEGGYWRNGAFFYNSAVNRFGGVHVTNVYERNVTHVTVNRYAFNGPGGVVRRPTPAEEQASREQHVPATALQTQHVQAARQNRALLASVNHGRPAVTATARPGAIQGGGARPGAEPMAPRPAAPGAASPHPVNRPLAGTTYRPVMQHPVTPARPMGGGMAPRPEGRPEGTMTPRPEGAMAPRPEGTMAPRPQGMAPRPEGTMAPRPDGGMAPHPMGQMAPHPMAAPHPAPAAHPAAPAPAEKPKG